MDWFTPGSPGHIPLSHLYSFAQTLGDIKYLRAVWLLELCFLTSAHLLGPKNIFLYNILDTPFQVISVALQDAMCTLEDK